MEVRELRIEGYRSIRKLWLPLGAVNIIVGPNGCGKSNLYRAMVLLSAAARGEFARTLATEGGMPSVLWAGARKRGSIRMSLGVTLDEWQYDLACGPSQSSSFPLDPMVKEERIEFIQHEKRREKRRVVPFLDRGENVASLRGAEGQWIEHGAPLWHTESVLSQIRDARAYPELDMLCRELMQWRFYQDFRTDRESPLRRAQPVVFTPALDHDGHDLAAALMTIADIGANETLEQAIDNAFPGARLDFISGADEGFLMPALQMPAITRPFGAREMSDGTLRYLCLLAALLSPRPPSLIALNEPETGIHPDLIAPLADLIVVASRASQVLVTTHSQPLAARVAELSGRAPVQLEMVDGETRILGQGLIA